MSIRKIALVLAATVFVGVLGVALISSWVPGFNFRNNLSRVGPSPKDQLAQVSSPSDYCQGYGDDRDYLYDLTTSIFTKGDGTQSFTSRRRSDNEVLRQSFADEQFFIDRSSGALQINYSIIDLCGGVNIVYTISNPTGQSQMPPDLRVEGITQRTSGDYYILDTRDSGYIRNVSRGGSLDNLYMGSNGRQNSCCNSTLTYPAFYYSPVIVTHDGDFTVGSALLYPQFQYNHEVVPQLNKITSGLQAGTWRHEYREFQKGYYGPSTDPTLLTPGEQRTYTITLRFTQPRAWILTLDPYKKYFRQTYGAPDPVRPQDLSPVLLDPIATVERFNRPNNPRAYNLFPPYDTLFTQGWGPYITARIAYMQSHGFNRAMLWAASGLYAMDTPCRTPLEPVGYGGQACNYPPAFMDFLPILESTANLFQSFNQNNLDLGFWWGRSSQIPVPDQWDPPQVVDADYNNPTQLAYLDNQLQLAADRGVKTIGLDYFGGTMADQVWRINRMRQQTNNQIAFVHEGSGPDITHRLTANFFNQYPWWTQWDKSVIAGPDVLSNYLNPGSEDWYLYLIDESCSQVQRDISWGLTPMVATCSSAQMDARGLDLNKVACFDGVDNDGDGKTDWPYDLGCSDAADNNETDPPVIPQCSDGADNDGDGLVDMADPGCDNSSDNDEFNSQSQSVECSDGVDNDGDNLIDYPADQGCSSTSDNSEQNTSSGRGRGGGIQGSMAPDIVTLLARIHELQATLAALQAKFAAHSGTSSKPSLPSSGTTLFKRDLTIGSSGADVTALQQFLVRHGFLTMPAGSVYGTFGTRTLDAVARMQIYSGISPANGYFGERTRARVNQF